MEPRPSAEIGLLARGYYYTAALFADLILPNYFFAGDKARGLSRLALLSLSLSLDFLRRGLISEGVGRGVYPVRPLIGVLTLRRTASAA